MAGSYGGETVGEEKLEPAQDKTAGVNMEAERANGGIGRL